MPKIRRWFNVSHDINSDPEVWELTDKFGVAGLRWWLEMLSIGDRNDGAVPDRSHASLRALSLKCNTTVRRVMLMYDFGLTKSWIVCDPSPRLRNYAIYRTSRETKKDLIASPPNTTLLTNTPKDKNKPPTVPKLEPKPWPPEDLWLKTLIEQQPHFQHALLPLLDFAWWEDISSALNGIEPSFIQPEFSKMSAWLRENPGRRFTTKGARRFIRSWLEKARENQRRLYAVKK